MSKVVVYNDLEEARAALMDRVDNYLIKNGAWNLKTLLMAVSLQEDNEYSDYDFYQNLADVLFSCKEYTEEEENLILYGINVYATRHDKTLKTWCYDVKHDAAVLYAAKYWPVDIGLTPDEVYRRVLLDVSSPTDVAFHKKYMELFKSGDWIEDYPEIEDFAVSAKGKVTVVYKDDKDDK